MGLIAQRSVMQYQIFVQNPTEKRFTASVVGIPACVAEGTTKEEALASVQLALDLFKNRKNGQINLFPALGGGNLGILLP